MQTPHSFIAYVDESGDEGFKLSTVPGTGSSHWFVLAAAVARTEDDHLTVDDMRDLRARFQLPKDRHVHFRKLSHSRKVEWSKRIGESHMKTIAVAVEKAALHWPERFSEDNRLYHYAARLLLERLSWCCRDGRHSQGDGRVRIVFSNRASLSYEDIRGYYRRPKQKDAVGMPNTTIDWSVIDINATCAIPSDKLAGLQVADAVAAATFAALSPDGFGNREDRYLQEMWPSVYRHKGAAIRHGLKTFPADSKAQALLPWVA